MNTTTLASALLLALWAAEATAVDSGAVVGGAVGGGVGAAVGSEIGGRDGAIVGGAIGGAIGAGIGASDEEPARASHPPGTVHREVIYVEQPPGHVPPGHGGIPPGQAKKGGRHPHGKW